MDFITQRYYSSMRLYRDRPDLLTRGRWHWCPPGALPLPFPHAFGSFTADPNSYHYEGQVGEVPGKQGRVRAPENPRYLGRNYCGSIQTWQQGALYSQRGTPPVDDEGVPICCVSGPPIPGGAECSGEAIWLGALPGAGVHLGGGVIEPSDAQSGAGVHLGGGVTDHVQSGAGLVVGGGVIEPVNPCAGLVVGGGTVEPSVESAAGLVVGGGTVEPSVESAAGLVVGGGVIELSDVESGAGLVVGGGVIEPEIPPGPDCAGAADVDLGQLVTETARPNGEDWFVINYSSSGTYHINLSGWPFGHGSVFVYSGTCAGLVTEALLSFSGCADFILVGPGTIYVRVLLAAAIPPTDYAFTVDSGAC